MLPKSLSIADLKTDSRFIRPTFLMAAYMTVISSIALWPDKRGEKWAPPFLSPPQEPFKKSAREVCSERAMMLSIYVSQKVLQSSQPPATISENENDPPPPPVKKRFPNFDPAFVEPLCLLAQHFGRDDIKALATILV